VDVRLEVEGVAWRGLAGGYGTLERREMEVRSWGRRGAARERRIRVELPAADGRLHPVETADTVEPVRILAG
jgi:hypothetical protein